MSITFSQMVRWCRISQNGSSDGSVLFPFLGKPCLIWWISAWYCVSLQEASFICSNVIDPLAFSGDNFLGEVYLLSMSILVDNV